MVWLWLSIIINLGFLCVFKYYNFFAESLSALFFKLGIQSNFGFINIVLPIGISFYTFHGLSYIIDIYKKRITPTVNLIDYALFVSFFPLLVAGPIERATHLLPQIQKKRDFDYKQSVNGLRQILWGLFKKIVIADNCAEFVNMIFDNYHRYPASALVLGAFFFAIQIYCDFSGYSDIALGTARLFGIELIQNFNFPYFSRDIAEFWRRWHISLTTWFRDYLYIPLGGSRGSKFNQVRNTFLIFIVSGLWHGANWTFIIWGALNAIYFIPLLLLKKNRNNLETPSKGRLLPTFKELIQIISTFSLVTFSWIFFRAESVSDAIAYIRGIFSPSLFILPKGDSLMGAHNPKIILALIAIMLIIEWIGRDKQYAIQSLGLNWARPLRWTLYISVIVAIFYFSGIQQQFIYFQF